MKKIFIEAPGKLILSGEHSAVYGHPAIVIAVDLTLSLSVECQDESNHSFFVDLLDYILNKLVQLSVFLEFVQILHE